MFLEDSDGATITQVIPETAAAKAGLRVGDKFRSVNGKKTADLDSFLAAMGRFDAGDEVKLLIQRGKGNEIVLNVVLGKRPERMPGLEEIAEVVEEPPTSRPAQAEAVERPTRLRRTRRATESAPSGGRPFVGVQVEEQDEGGLLITEVVDGGPSAAAGVQVGDRLIGLGRADKVRTLSDLTGVLGKLHAGQTVRAVVRRGDDTETLSIKLGTRPLDQGEGGPARARSGTWRPSTGRGTLRRRRRTLRRRRGTPRRRPAPPSASPPTPLASVVWPRALAESSTMPGRRIVSCASCATSCGRCERRSAS